jgi:hypothetical protein
MNDRIKKLAKNVSELLPDDPKDPQDVYDAFSVVYRNQSDYFRNLGPENIIKLVFYIYSLKDTGSFSLGDKIINNLSFASLFTTSGNYADEECPACEGSATVSCDNCDYNGRVDCPTCDGTGDDSEGEPCDDCQGGGEVYCDECGGDGEVRCDECGGDGTVETDRSEITHHFICSWSDEINRPCELEEGTREPAMSEYDFDRLRGTDYITLYYEESSIELRNFVGVNEMYCVTHEDEPRLFMNNRYLQIFWDDSHNFYTYRL